MAQTGTAGVDDLDGDGILDILVGAHGADSPAASGAGVALVFSGVDGAAAYRIYDPIGETGDQFGKSVANAGDLDGDGVDDLLIGVPGDDEMGSGSGAVLAFSGGNFLELLGRSVDPDGADGDGLGYRVAALGDVDGDGISDFVATLTDQPGPGGVYFYLVRGQAACKDGTFNTEFPGHEDRDLELMGSPGMCD